MAHHGEQVVTGQWGIHTEWLGANVLKRHPPKWLFVTLAPLLCSAEEPMPQIFGDPIAKREEGKELSFILKHACFQVVILE